MSEIRCRPLTLKIVLTYSVGGTILLPGLCRSKILFQKFILDWFAKMLASDVDIGLVSEMIVQRLVWYFLIGTSYASVY